MNIAYRVRGLLAEQWSEWAAISAEPGDATRLLAGYVAPLAAVPALFAFIGGSIVGAVVPGRGVVRIAVVDGLLGAVFGFAVGCAIVFVLAGLIDLLAPRFGGQRNFDRAFKLAAYALTPVWLAGVFLVLPGLNFLLLAGLYGVLLLWTGLPRMMNTPDARTPGFAFVVLIAAAVLIAIALAVCRTLFASAVW